MSRFSFVFSHSRVAVFIFFPVHGQLNLALYAVCDLSAGNANSYYTSRTISAVDNKIKRMVES